MKKNLFHILALALTALLFAACPSDDKAPVTPPNSGGGGGGGGGAGSNGSASPNDSKETGNKGESTNSGKKITVVGPDGKPIKLKGPKGAPQPEILKKLTCDKMNINNFSSTAKLGSKIEMGKPIKIQPGKYVAKSVEFFSQFDSAALEGASTFKEIESLMIYSAGGIGSESLDITSSCAFAPGKNGTGDIIYSLSTDDLKKINGPDAEELKRNFNSDSPLNESSILPMIANISEIFMDPDFSLKFGTFNSFERRTIRFPMRLMEGFELAQDGTSYFDIYKIDETTLVIKRVSQSATGSFVFAVFYQWEGDLTKDEIKMDEADSRANKWMVNVDVGDLTLDPSTARSDTNDSGLILLTGYCQEHMSYIGYFGPFNISDYTLVNKSGKINVVGGCYSERPRTE